MAQALADFAVRAAGAFARMAEAVVPALAACARTLSAEDLKRLSRPTGGAEEGGRA
jgi:hypothetical protein